MKIIILAAGYAVRLRPLTLNMPKPLLKIGSMTILDRIIDKLAVIKDWDDIYIVTNEIFYKKFIDWASDAHGKKNIYVVNDGTTDNENRLGAIKDMYKVIKDKDINDDTLVIAGDNLFEFDARDFIHFARSRPDGVSVALYDIGDISVASNFGVVAIDDKCRVIDFEEKPEKPKSSLVSTGIYYFPKNKLSFIEKYDKMQFKMDAPGYYLSWLSGQDKVYGFKFSEKWYDIGSIDSYNKANREYSEKERQDDGEK